MGAKYLRRDLHTLAYSFCLCLNEKAFKQELKSLNATSPIHFVTDGAGACVHHFLYNGKPIAIVCLREKPGLERNQIYSMLAHEAVHIWQLHCDQIGEKHPSSEFEAYSIQHISQELFRSYEEQKKKK